MEVLLNSFEQTFINSLEAAAMVVLVLALTTIFRRKLTPSWRYALWLLLIIKLLFPLLPGNLASELRWNSFSGVIGERNAVEMFREAPAWLDASSVQLWVQAKDGFINLSNETVRNASTLPIRLASIIWLFGIVAVALYLAAGHIRMAVAVRKEACSGAPGELQQIFECTRRNCGIRRHIGLKLTRVVSSPTLFGFFSPVVLIPHHLANQLDAADWECVFRHEFTHFKRKDIGVNALFALLAAVHWFNPLIWHSLHRMRIDQETSCDAIVLKNTGATEAYANCMVKILEIGVSQRRAVAGVRFSGYKNQIARRIVMIRHFQPTKKRVTFIGMSIVIAVALIALPSALAKEDARDGALAPEREILSPPVQSNEGEGISESPSRIGELETLIMPASGRIASTFGYRTHPVSEKKSLHDGVDIANEEGTAIYAAAAGRVIRAEYAAEKGLSIVIEHAEGLQSEYRHMSELLVQEGATVQSGEQIGLMGSTGQATGPHLHFSIIKDGEYADPAEFIAGLAPTDQ